MHALTFIYIHTCIYVHALGCFKNPITFNGYTLTSLQMNDATGYGFL